MADDYGQDVVCPRCKSDNIRPIEKSYLPIVGKILTAAIAAVIGFIVIPEHHVIDPPPVPPSFPPEDSSEIHPPVPPVISDVTYPEREGSSQTYYITVTSESQNVSHFELRDGDAVIMKSQDGKFSGIPASRNEATYHVYAVASDGTESNPWIVPGFEPIEIVSKATKEEVQRLINTRQSKVADNRKVFAQKVKVTTVDASSDDILPNDFQGIFSNFSWESWESVQVVNLGYDSENRVNAVTVRPIYPKQ